MPVKKTKGNKPKDMKPELHNFHGLISTLHMRTVMLHGHAGKDPGEMVVCKDKSLLDRGDCKVPASCCFEKLERGSFKQGLSTLGPY